MKITLALFLLTTTVAHAAAPNPAVFCNTKRVHYSGSERILQVEVRNGQAYGQVILIRLSGHPNIVGTQLVYEEPVSIEGGSVKGKLFQLTFNPASLPAFDDRERLDVNASSTSDFTSVGVSRFFDNRPNQFAELICRAGSYKQRVAVDPILDWSDEFEFD